MTEEQERQCRVIELAAERGKALFSNGYNITTAELLKQICFVLHSILLKNTASDADRIAAADALYRIHFGENSPIDLITVP